MIFPSHTNLTLFGIFPAPVEPDALIARGRRVPYICIALRMPIPGIHHGP